MRERSILFLRVYCYCYCGVPAIVPLDAATRLVPRHVTRGLCLCLCLLGTGRGTTWGLGHLAERQDVERDPKTLWKAKANGQGVVPANDQ